MATVSFTCISCRVAFNDADIQRAHYRTDWHRYNLKRKVAELPPVSSDNFQQRVFAQRQQAADLAENHSSHCSVCNKYFQSQNSYDNHLHSKKHRELQGKETLRLQKEEEKKQEKGLVEVENEKNLEKCNASRADCGESQGAQGALPMKDKNLDSNRTEADEDNDSDAESWDEDTIALEECLFCSKVSKSLDKNIEHMASHGFYVPDVEYITDLEGLLTYLGEKVGVGHVCLWCNEKGRSFHSTKAVQQHMSDRGHCKMLTDGDVVMEYADYYDYRQLVYMTKLCIGDFEDDHPGVKPWGQKGVAIQIIKRQKMLLWKQKKQKMMMRLLTSVTF